VTNNTKAQIYTGMKISRYW